ncbi:hypothetical protein PTKIN_Ptkin12aG0041200 [Pterospermum kingtungense]
MALTISLFPSSYARKNLPIIHHLFNTHPFPNPIKTSRRLPKLGAPTPPILCTAKPSSSSLKTCKNCKTQFDPLLNHPRACRFHTAHFGGETKRKFESVYAGGTMDTPDSGKVFQYWHCCGSEDPFDPGCTAAPHASYDD